MSLAFKEWDPAGVIVFYGPTRLKGFAEGTFVRGERNEDTFRLVKGVDGEYTRERIRARGGRLTLTLLQSSSSNLVLSGLMTAAELGPNAIPALPLIVKTATGASLFFAAEAWPVKPTDQEYGEDLGVRVWVFESGSVQITDAGLTAISSGGGVLEALNPF